MPSAMSRGVGLVLLVFASLPVLGDPPEAQAILDAADKVRNPQRPFQMTMTLVDYVHGKERERVTLGIHAKIGAQDIFGRQTGERRKFRCNGPLLLIADRAALLQRRRIRTAGECTRPRCEAVEGALVGDLVIVPGVGRVGREEVDILLIAAEIGGRRISCSRLGRSRRWYGGNSTGSPVAIER